MVMEFHEINQESKCSEYIVNQYGETIKRIDTSNVESLVDHFDKMKTVVTFIATGLKPKENNSDQRVLENDDQSLEIEKNNEDSVVQDTSLEDKSDKSYDVLHINLDSS